MTGPFSTLKEAQAAVNAGRRVYWQTPGYQLVCINSDWGVQCETNGHWSALYWRDGKTSDYRAADFYLAKED